MEINVSRKTALLLGASGLVGGYCLEELLEHPAYARVRVLTRRSLRRRHPRLEEHIVSFDRLHEHSDLFRCHDCYICLGTTMAKAGSREAFYRVDFTYVYEAARLSSEAGANQLLLVSAVGASPSSPFFYSRVKGEVEEAVRQLPFWAVRIFKPSVLLGERPESRWGEKVAGRIGRGIDRVTGGLLSRYRPIEAELVAMAMVNTAQYLRGGVQVYHSEDIPRLAGEPEEQ